MKWKELKQEIEREITRLEENIAAGNYSEERAKTELKKVYEQIIKMNNFVKHADGRIRVLAQQVKSRTSSQSGLSSFVQSMKIAPVDLTTFIDKGWNFMVDEQYDDAIEILEKAHKLAPKDIKTMNLLGWAYIHKERYDDAMIIFQSVLNLDPENALAKNNLGFVCFKKGIYGEAIEHLTSVLHSSQEKMSLIYANFYLGLIYLEREMYDDAGKFFKDTINHGPNHLEAFFYLATTYYRMGLKRKAIEVFNDIIAKNKYNKWAQRAEEKIKEINGEDNEEEN